MILADRFPIPNWISLVVIVLVLGSTISASLLATYNGRRRRERK
jgi:hypothetical protein